MRGIGTRPTQYAPPSISGSASGRGGPHFPAGAWAASAVLPCAGRLGGARLLAGDLAGAIATLDASLKADPKIAHALFLRARAKELAGQKDAALADYNLASRTAFAEAQDLASGEAHLYRGIVLFRRKDFRARRGGILQRAEFRDDRRAASGRPRLAPSGRRRGRFLRPAREVAEGALACVSPFFPTR